MGANEPLLERVRHLLGPLIARRGLTVKSDGPSSMGEEVVQLDCHEFEVLIRRDRWTNPIEWIEVGSKIRPRPHAPLRRYLLCRVIAYRYGSDPDHAGDLEAEARWLIDHEEEILDSALLNAEELRLWNVDAARVMLGQKPRGKWPRRGWCPPRSETSES